MSGEKLTHPVVCARHSRPIVRAEANSLHAALLYLRRPFQTSVTRYTPSTWMRTRHEARDPRSTKLVRRTRYLAELTQCTRLLHSPLLSSFPRPFTPSPRSSLPRRAFSRLSCLSWLRISAELSDDRTARSNRRNSLSATSASCCGQRET